MAEFTPINTQEEFDALIKDRIERAKESTRKEYADYEDVKKKLCDKDAELSKMAERLTSLDAANKDLTAKLSASETDSAKTRIALENGLPFEFKDRLRGSTEDEIRADAQLLAKFFASQKPAAPLYNPDGGDGNANALKGLSDALKSR